MEEKRIQAIVTFVRGLLDRTEESLQVSEDVAFLLLDHYHWDQNQLVSNWETSKDQLIETFHINMDCEDPLGSKLEYKDCGSGTCPICNKSGKKLYQLYCGHRICRDCFQEDVKNAVIKSHIPVCHQDCNAELLAHDVEKILPGSKHAKAYKWWRLNKSFSESHYNVALCPNPLCRYLIVQEGTLSTKLVNCPNCDFAFCMDCLHDSHAPLCCCNHMHEFVEDNEKQLYELEEEEKKWFKRESTVIEYRFQNKEDLTNSLDQGIRAISNAYNDEQEEIKQQITNTDLFSDQILTQITQTEDKIKEFVSKKKSPEMIEQLKVEVQALREELEHYSNFKKDLENENEIRKQQRKKDVDFAEKQKKIFLKAVLNREKYDVYMKQYRENLDKFADERSKRIENEEDYIRKNTYMCPQCKQRFYKVNPCCQVACPCGYEFCTLCNEPWITHKKGYCECQNDPNVITINYDDKSDLMYKPCPYNLERKTYFDRWKRFHDSFVASRGKYDEYHQKFLTYDADAKKETQSFTKLVRRLEQENVQDARTAALRLISRALFVQSVATWGYPAIFYRRECEFTKEYIEKLQALEAKNDEFVALLNEPAQVTAQELEQKSNEVKDEVDLVLRNKF